MEAIKTAQQAHPAPTPSGAPQLASPDPSAVTDWLLEGRYFTTDAQGAITTWSQGAAEVFGWSRTEILGLSYVPTLVAPNAREAEAERLQTVLSGSGDLAAGLGLAVEAVTTTDEPLLATFAIVPIQIGAGYQFNALLQEVGSRPASATSRPELRDRRQSVMTLIGDALNGRHVPEGASADAARLAGLLITFEAAAVRRLYSAGAGNVVPIVDAAVDESGAQLELEPEKARAELRSLEAQLHEAREEAQRARSEANVARHEANDAREALALAQLEAEDARRSLEDARRERDAVRNAADSQRIRLETDLAETQTAAVRLREAEAEFERLRCENALDAEAHGSGGHYPIPVRGA